MKKKTFELTKTELYWIEAALKYYIENRCNFDQKRKVMRVYEAFDFKED